VKHESTHGKAVPDEFHPEEHPLLEGQIVNLADDIAYGGHDVDDGLSLGFLSLDLIRETGFLSKIYQTVLDRLTEKSEDMIRYAIVRALVNLQATDLISEIKRRIEENNIVTLADVRESKARLVAFSDSQHEFNQRLKKFLSEHMYHHSDLNRMKNESFEIISFLFNFYLSNFNTIPDGFRTRFPEVSPHRLVADYIAGMTDRYAQSEFSKYC